MTTHKQTVLISGASIAGPTLAYWLKRYGFTPTVVERSPALRRGGFPIDVRNAAVEIAKRMGIWFLVPATSLSMWTRNHLSPVLYPFIVVPGGIWNRFFPQPSLVKDYVSFSEKEA